MPPRRVPPQGQLRQSQVVTTFGPGSMIDLPDHSVIVGGLDHWEGSAREIDEPRLVEKLLNYFREQGVEVSALKLREPPPETDDPSAPRSGITAWQFPEWFITQKPDLLPNGGRTRRLVHLKALTKGLFVDDDRKKHDVVPVRFVRACSHGHISDIDWRFYAHGGDTDCTRRKLWMDEHGTSGDLTELSVRCECGVSRSLALAQKNPQLLRHCRGERPWLGIGNREGCTQPSRLLIRSASNAYFSQVMSVISLPPANEAAADAVGRIYPLLEGVESLEHLQFFRRKQAPIKEALDGLGDDEVWTEIQIRKGLLPAPASKSVKKAEFEAFQRVVGTIGSDSATFHAEELLASSSTDPVMDHVEKVVLVHRLREVMAQAGFTRFEASTPDVEGELQLGVQVAPLAREMHWLPAVENRGEGVFIQFKTAAIEAWLEKDEVKARHQKLVAGFDAWLAQPGTERPQTCDRSERPRAGDRDQAVAPCSVPPALLGQCSEPAASLAEQGHSWCRRPWGQCR